MAGRHTAPGRFSKGVVKQLSNLSIDEVSLVDRGANQHAVLEIAKAYTADDIFDAIDDYEDAEIEKKLSLAGGGASSNKNPKKAGAKEEYHGDDPTGVTDDQHEPDDGDVGPGETISGVETTSGETCPPGNGKSKKGVKKSAGFWENFVSKVLDEEFTTEDLDAETIGKHFPGAGAANPMQSPFPGATGMGQPPTMQTVGAQGTPMGQPTPPPMGAQPPGGMPGAAPGAMPGQAPMGGMGNLPPEVVQYIQQLEQQVQQLSGGDGSESTDDSQSDPSASSESKSDDNSKKNPFGKSGDFDMTDTTFLSELAKSLDDEDQRETFGKALEAVSKAEQRAQEAEEIAKSERDLRLEREFVSKAADFSVPVSPQVLGPVLKRMSEALDVEDLAVIVKCLRSSSAQSSALDIFAEVGKRGGGSNGSVLDEVEQRAQEFVEKGLTQEAGVAAVLDLNPRAYDEYLSSRQNR